MQSRVRVSRIGIETLANHENRFAMRIAWRQRRNMDFCRKRDVARDFFPNEMKGVGAKPHVGAAALEGVGAVGEINFAWKCGRADVGRRFEDAKVCGDYSERSRNSECSDGAQHNGWQSVSE